MLKLYIENVRRSFWMILLFLLFCLICPAKLFCVETMPDESKKIQLSYKQISRADETYKILGNCALALTYTVTAAFAFFKLFNQDKSVAVSKHRLFQLLNLMSVLALLRFAHICWHNCMVSVKKYVDGYVYFNELDPCVQCEKNEEKN